MSKNPLHDLIAVGRMPVILELHLTEGDKIAYQQLRQRHLAQGYELPNLTVLGQYLRQMDVTSGELTAEERALVDKLQVYADFVSSGSVDLLALSDGPRGRDTLDNAIAAALIIGLGADPARIMANIVARDRQADQIRGRLLHFAELGVRNALLLTGDLPVGSRPAGPPARFPLDSVGMCALARKMLIEGVLPDDFWIAAAGHPNPEADPDGLRTLQKALAGAKVIITQAIYSVEQFTQWMQSLSRLGVLDQVHVLAEVIPITSASQLRSIAEVPGIRVPLDLIEELDAAKKRLEQTATEGGHSSEWVKLGLRNEGARMTRALLHRIRKVSGVSGFYLGCVKGFDAHRELLREAPLLPEQGQSLHKIAKISGAERQQALANVPSLESFLDRLVRQSQRRQGRARYTGRLAYRGWVQGLFKLLEWPKVPLFGCKKCDRCDLSSDALICPRGCAKQMTHGPCGAPRLVDGRVLCEDTSRECTWAAIGLRRGQYGVPIAERLEVREAPSSGFYEGRTYSAVLPVLVGGKRGPNWSLAWRAPLARVARVIRSEFKLKAEGEPRDLTTLVESQGEQLLSIIAERPSADREELLVKALALIGTPAAWCLIESRLAELGLPAEGTISDLSLREQFQLAEALPTIRRRFVQSADESRAHAPPVLSEELLSVIPEGRRLRQGMRRELANPLISHIASLGVNVTYVDSMLDTKFVDDFLTALIILKDELQVARARLPFEPGGLSIYFHRVHYKHHYHAPIAIHRFHADDNRAERLKGLSADCGGTSECTSPQRSRALRLTARVRLSVDLRQFQSAARFRANLRDALEKLVRGESESSGAILLEDYGPGMQSVCWEFNTEFWKRLREFEQATGKSYDASIGGSTDHNLAYARASARALFDKVHDHHLGGQQLYVLEIGVASTHRARSFLGEFRRICELTGTGYHRNTTYVLADNSETLLAGAAAELSREHPSVEIVKIDAGNPSAALARYHARVIHAHLCNVYDNLPSDQLLWLDESWYRTEVRLYLPRQAFDEVVARHGFEPTDRATLENALKTLDHSHEATKPRSHAAAKGGQSAIGNTVGGFLDWCKKRLIELGRPPSGYIHFWMDLFAALRLDERCVAVNDVEGLLSKGIAGMDSFAPRCAHQPLAPSLKGDGADRRGADAGEMLQGFSPRQHSRVLSLPGGTRDIRVHFNQAALNGFAQLLPILHPHGTLEIVDLFVQRLEEYHQAFKGPAKYDGSTVNWLNGPLFRAVAERLGYTVRFQPFRPFDPRSSSVALIAYPSP